MAGKEKMSKKIARSKRQAAHRGEVKKRVKVGPLKQHVIAAAPALKEHAQVAHYKRNLNVKGISTRPGESWRIAAVTREGRSMIEYHVNGVVTRYSFIDLRQAV